MRRALVVTACCAALGPSLLTPRGVASQTPHTLTGSVSLVGDYRFRGLSQTYTQPAVQVGFEYAHALGWYAGIWGSNVSGNQFLNGGSLEMDLYGGYRRKVGKVDLDAGLLRYWYPRARYNIDPGDAYNTIEIYVGAHYRWVTAKYFLALSDLFGMKTGTIGGFCGITSDATPVTTNCLGTGSSQGSGYFDLTLSLPVAPVGDVVVHVGHQSVLNYESLSYWDYKVGVSKNWAGLIWGAAVTGTDAEGRFYRYTPTTTGSTETEYVGGGTIVLSLGKTF